jgi:hypothetical protein
MVLGAVSVMRLVFAAVVLLVSACAGRECRPVEEVYRKTEASAELKEPLLLVPPAWVWPADPAALSCLTEDGEDLARNLDFALLERVCMWEAWAGLPVSTYCERFHNGRSDKKN